MKVGIIGAGTMGAGIAQVFAVTEGYEVVLCDLKLQLADRGKVKIERSLAKLVGKGKLSEQDKDNFLSKVTTGTKENLDTCDLVIEAAVENMELKKALFAELSTRCNSETMFATNTSSLSVTELSSGADRPVIGMHFFNPAPVMKLVEVIAGLETPPELVEKIMRVSAEIGKTPIQVKENAGFVVNRMLVPMINEAIGLYADGVAAAKDIDTAMKLGANHPMGPLALGDLIGLDIILAVMEVIQHETGDPKYRPHPLLRKMVRGGQSGVKAGRGFYNYDQ